MIPTMAQQSCTGTLQNTPVISPPTTGTIILTLPADGVTRPTLLTLTNTLDPASQLLHPESLITMATNTSTSCSTTSTAMATTPISSTILDLANMIETHQSEPLDLSTPTMRENLTLASSLTSEAEIIPSATGDTTTSSATSTAEVTTTVIDPELAVAALTAVTSGSITPLIKEELRCTIQQKRLSNGKDELKVEYQEPEPSKMSAEEEEKRRKRRERNRIAAQKCRTKRKEKADILQEETEQLESHNRKLREEIEKLEEEKERLRHMLATHDILPTKCNMKLSVSEEDDLEVKLPMVTEEYIVMENEEDEDEDENFILDQVL